MVKKSVELLACTEAAQTQEAPRTTISDRSVQILTEMRRPMHQQDVCLLAEMDGLDEIKLGSLNGAFRRMVRKGTIVRVEKGVYSLPEFADEEYKLPDKITNQAKLSTLLKQAGKPLHLAIIDRLLESEGYEPEDMGNIDLTLPLMVRKGTIVRVKKGVYSLPEFADEEYKLPKLSIRARIKTVLTQAECSLPTCKITSEIEEDGYGALSRPDSVYPMLNSMVRWGDLVRTDRGLYCLPEFADKEYKLPGATMGERSTVALWQAGRPLHWEEIQWLTETDGLGEMLPGSFRYSLNRMVRRDLLVRHEPGTFSLPEFACASEEDSSSYITKTEVTRKILRIITEIGGSASLDYIYLSLANSNLEALSLKNISDMLNRMAQEEEPKRKIVRTAENTYCLLGSDEEEYEIPESGIQNKLLAIFRSAHQPLQRQKLHQLVEEDYGALKEDGINAFLTSMVNEGILVRITAGVYSLPEFADQAYEVPRLTIEMRTIEVLEKARQPLHRSEIARLIDSDGQIKVGLTSVQNTLIMMAGSNTITRVKPGVYSLPEFANENYELPRTTLEGRLMSVLQEARRPLELQEICHQVVKDGRGAIKWLQSAHATLTWMADEGIVIKTAKGTYSMPEFAKEPYKPFKLTVGIMVRESLAEARQPLPLANMHRLVNNRGEEEVDLASLRVELGRLTNKGAIVRVARGVYSLPEFADSTDN